MIRDHRCLLENKDVQAIERRDVRPPQPDHRRCRHPRRGGPDRGRQARGRRRRRRLPGMVGDRPEASGARSCSRPPTSWQPKAPQFIELMAAETGATAGWAGFNVHLAAGMLREAAAMTTQISGEVIPSDKPGCIAMAVRQPAGVVLEHRAVERAGHPRRARDRDAAGLRQHRGAQGLGDLPGHAPPDRGMPARGGPAARRRSMSSPTRRRMRRR